MVSVNEVYLELFDGLSGTEQLLCSTWSTSEGTPQNEAEIGIMQFWSNGNLKAAL